MPSIPPIAPDPYATLGVPPDADDETIRSSYMKLAKRLHPDRNAGDARSVAAFHEATQAYDILRDPRRRAVFDSLGWGGIAALTAAEEADAAARSRRKGRKARGNGETATAAQPDATAQPTGAAVRGRDIVKDADVSYLVACSGGEVPVEVTRRVRCPSCLGKGSARGSKPVPCVQCEGTGRLHWVGGGVFSIEVGCPDCKETGNVPSRPCRQCGGSGTIQVTRTLAVAVPPNVGSGTRLRLQGEGEYGEGEGAEPGDVWIVLHVPDAELFVREGCDLRFDLEIGLVQAALGCRVTIPGPGGESIVIEIDEGVQSGTALRIAGKGLPDGKGNMGDLYVDVRVATPMKLNERQRTLLAEFLDASEGDEGAVPGEDP
jgi:molecular chaperone DnaJ